MLKFFSIKTNKLSKKNILDIIKLKNIKWKYGLKKQQIFFKKNIKKFDSHNMLYDKKILVGYTCLRKLKFKRNSRSFKYLIFDTLIIRKKYRHRGFGDKIMKFNNKIIKKQKLTAFLICQKRMVFFYRKFNWIDSQKIFKKKNIMFYPEKLNTKIFNVKNLVELFKL